jgi:hypothetical protein
VLKGYEPKYQCTLLRTDAAEKVVYFIAIIDILQQFTMRKAIAHTIKSLSLGSLELMSIFIDFPERWGKMGNV